MASTFQDRPIVHRIPGDALTGIGRRFSKQPVADKENPIYRQQEIIKQIVLPEGMKIVVGSAAVAGGFYLQIESSGALPRGRRWPLLPDMSDNSVVETAFLAAQTYVVDRLRRSFKLAGHAIFHPDMNIHALVEIGNRSATPIERRKIECTDTTLAGAIASLSEQLALPQSYFDRKAVRDLAERTVNADADVPVTVDPVTLLTPQGRIAYVAGQAPDNKSKAAEKRASKRSRNRKKN